MIDIDIANLIAGYSAKDALDALYYTARFIKQADSLSKNDKDFFDDDARSSPSDEAKVLTAELIAEIEKNAGQPAAKFGHSLVIQILLRITSAERALDFEFTSAEEKGAEEAIASMIEPVVQAKGKS